MEGTRQIRDPGHARPWRDGHRLRRLGPDHRPPRGDQDRQAARQPTTRRPQEELARFRREAQAAGRLTHPNIVGVFDYGETDDIAYIVMEYRRRRRR